MTVKIYGPTASRAARALWIVHELNIPFEHVAMEMKDLKGADYLKINPNGKVPTLVDGNFKLFESMAINPISGLACPASWGASLSSWRPPSATAATAALCKIASSVVSTRPVTFFSSPAARSMPTVIISGDADKTVYPDIHSRPLAATLPHAKLILLPGVGHMVQNAVPDLVKSEIEAMIDAIASTQAAAD